MDRLALFDLDNTLINLSAAFGCFAEEFAEGRGLDAAAVRWLVATGGDGYLPREELFGRAAERYALRETVEELVGLYRLRMPELAECRDEVLAGLASLRADGWRVGIVTNGDAANQQGKVDRTGLAEVVDVVCVSGALGVRKPDPGIFEIAAERAGCVLGPGGWMVGDNPTADIGGGAGVGLRTVWVRKPGDRLPPGLAEPDRTIRDVTEAFDIVRGSA